MTGGGGGGIHPDLLVKWHEQLTNCDKYLHQAIGPSGTIHLDEASNERISVAYRVKENIVQFHFTNPANNNFDHIVTFLTQKSAFSPFVSKKIEAWYKKTVGKEVHVVQKPRQL